MLTSTDDPFDDLLGEGFDLHDQLDDPSSSAHRHHRLEHGTTRSMLPTPTRLGNSRLDLSNDALFDDSDFGALLAVSSANTSPAPPPPPQLGPLGSLGLSPLKPPPFQDQHLSRVPTVYQQQQHYYRGCLLYTSDAADE